MKRSCLPRWATNALPKILYNKLLIHQPQALRNEFASIDALGPECSQFRFKDIHDCDLSIWEAQVKGPALKPGQREQDHQTWETEEGSVLFQRYGPPPQLKHSY